MAINAMYAEMARAAKRRAVKAVEEGCFNTANNAASHAVEWAKRAGGNALRWGL